MKKAVMILAVSLFCTGFVQAGYTDIIADTTISSGTYNVIRVFGAANLDFYGDTADLLDFQDTSTGSFYGGTVGEINVAESAVIELWGGQISLIYSRNIVHIYGQNITVEPYYTDDLRIYGFWSDGVTPFDFIAGRAIPYNSQFVIHEVPEPLTLFFMLSGILGTRKLRR